MLYLVICEVKDSQPFPQEVWIKMVTDFFNSMICYKEKGKILYEGGFAGREGGFCVFDVESNEELNMILSVESIWPFMDKEIIPLITLENQSAIIKQLSSKFEKLVD